MWTSIRRLLSRWRLRIEAIREARKLRRQVIAHEAGHALAAWLLPAFGEVALVSIVPAGPYRGYTITSAGGSGVFSDRDVFQAMVMSMAGMASERLLIGEVSEGGQDDMHGVLAAWLQMRHGLSPLAADGIATSLMLDIYGDDEIRRANASAFAAPVLSTFHALACELLGQHLRALRRVAKALKRRKYLKHADLIRLLGPRRTIDPELLFGPSEGSA